MSRSARSEILGRIRAARSREPGGVTVPREYHGPGVMTGKDPAALLADRLADYGALVRRTPAAAAPAAIAAALRERGAHRVAARPTCPPIGSRRYRSHCSTARGWTSPSCPRWTP